MYTENLDYFTVVQVQFSQDRFTGTEDSGFIVVNLVLSGGTSASPFNVTVTPSEQLPVSAQGNSVMCVLLCVDWRMFD